MTYDALITTFSRIMTTEAIMTTLNLPRPRTFDAMMTTFDAMNTFDATFDELGHAVMAFAAMMTFNTIMKTLDAMRATFYNIYTFSCTRTIFHGERRLLRLGGRPLIAECPSATA